MVQSGMPACAMIPSTMVLSATLPSVAALARGGLCAAAVAASLALSAGMAGAQDTRQNEVGKFDFYVLALSWSPSFCDASARAQPRPDQQPAEPAATPAAPQQQQCGERPYAFVVHGLWPQYEKGFPEYCQVPAPRLNRAIVSSMLDLMPAPQLIFREWDRHGTCSGLAARAYFDTIRKARAVVKIPTEYLEMKAPLTVTPDEVEEAFVKANPGLTRESLAVGCDNQRLREIRICMTRELGFRACAEVDGRACRRDKLAMPPVRGS
jgi:ribonuclease T2